MDYKVLRYENVDGKTVFLRVDLNSSVHNGKPVIGKRIKAHAETIKYLNKRNCKLVIVSHQGRRGEKNFISLKPYARILSQLVGTEIRFCGWKENYLEKIKGLRNKDILLLENTRFREGETEERKAILHARESYVEKLAQLADVFVQDALSICHRSHASVVGFCTVPSFIGPVLEKELKALEEVDKCDGRKTLLLGGAKPRDSLKLAESMMEHGRADGVLLGGVPGEIALASKNMLKGKTVEFLEKKGLKEVSGDAEKLMEKFHQSVFIPKDLAFEYAGKRIECLVEELPSSALSKDIGARTVAEFSEKIKESGLVVFNGPVGVFEEKNFQFGTKSLLNSISESKAFSLLGGGDTETALETLGFEEGNFSHVSLAGKALLQYLAGKKMPGLEVLKK